MKVLVLSDIHGNFDALEAVLKDARKYPWKELWFLGDLGGYGPETEQCFQLIKSLSTVMLAGNHDLYYANRISRKFFSREALTALLLAGSSVRRQYIDIMKILPSIQTRKGITLVHGSLISPETDYILYKKDALSTLNRLKGNCCLFGHTHRQGCYLQDREELRWIRPEVGQVVNYKKKRILINPGSVGQPRDHDPRAAWAQLDTRLKEVQFFRTEYDISSVQAKMKKMGSTDFLIERLETGT